MSVVDSSEDKESDAAPFSFFVEPSTSNASPVFGAMKEHATIHRSITALVGITARLLVMLVQNGWSSGCRRLVNREHQICRLQAPL